MAEGRGRGSALLRGRLLGAWGKWRRCCGGEMAVGAGARPGLVLCGAWSVGSPHWPSGLVP